MLRLLVFVIGAFSSMPAFSQQPPASEPPPPAVEPSPPPAAPVPSTESAAPASNNGEQQRFEQFRRDLVSLLALRAEPDLLVAAAELAYPDADDKNRAAQLKSPALMRRAQKFGPDDALVAWIATFIGCGADASTCRNDAAARLQKIAPDNVAVWLPSLHAAQDPGQARALLASMAQAQRFDDYWAASVLAVFDALQTLPVPAEVLSHGLNQVAARINLATSVGGGFLPNYARLGEMCRGNGVADEALTVDCLAVAKLLESGGSFRSQAIGFGIEDSLLPPGTARAVLKARQRTSAWQKEQFLEVSSRFPRDESLAKSYIDLLREQGNELAKVTALLRRLHLPTEPESGWQPESVTPVPSGDPRALPPAGH